MICTGSLYFKMGTRYTISLPVKLTSTIKHNRNVNSNRECVVNVFFCMLHTFIYFILFSVAVIGGFQGNEYITYYYTTTQETHTNDISLRFKSFLRNAFLFQTVSSSSTDYLRGELDNGRIKVTIKVEGQPPQVILCNWYLC